MRGKYGRTRPYYNEFDGQIQVIKSGSLTLDDFTDVAANGYVDLDTKLPAGAIPLAWQVTVDKGFTDVKSFTPADGTKIMFRQDTLASDVDMILDLTDCTVITPEDGTTIAFTNTTNSTITDSADGFGDVVDGDLILVQGSTSNDGVYEITTATDAGTLTLTGEKFATAEAGIEGVTFTILNNASTGGFVAAGLVATDGITISGSTSNDGDIAASDITTVTAGVITLGNTVLADAEDGVAGIVFTKAITTTAVVQLGVAGDVDRFSADTAQSVAAIGSKGSMALAADACDGIGGEQTVRLTVTEGSDFSSYTGGALSAKLFYLT
jgi:hypothetical protein